MRFFIEAALQMQRSPTLANAVYREAVRYFMEARFKRSGRPLEANAASLLE